MRLNFFKAVKTDTAPSNLELFDFISVTEKDISSFLYIGRDKKVFQSISNHFDSGSFSEDLSSVEKFLEHSFQDNKLLAAIFIDIPLDLKSANKLQQSLVQKRLSHVPIIYNQKQLAHCKVQLIKQVELIEKCGFIDDVFDISADSSSLLDKIDFLKEFKSKNKTTYNLEDSSLYIAKESFTPNYKRIFDIVIASLAILFLLPLFLIIAIAIKLESKGPIIYSSLRAGRGFKIFKFYKFRSMFVDADKKIHTLSHLNQYNVNGNGPTFIKIENDPRITKVGKFLRNTSLDELPQLFNVLKGDMSIVGNRPLPLYEAETLTTNDFVERFYAPAGITGLWQTKKRGKADMSVEERIGLDISYARKYNLLYDLKILASTPSALLQQNNV